MTVRRRRTIAFITCVTVIGVLIFVQMRQLQNPHLAALPSPNWTNVHPATRNAIRSGESEVRRRPDSAEAWLHLGMVYMANASPEEALQCFAVADRIDPTGFRWPYLSGIILEENDVAAARASYVKAFDRETGYVPLLLRLASVSVTLGDLDSARDYAERAIAAAPDEALPVSLLGRIERVRGRLEAAAEHFAAAAALAPMSRQLRLDLANTHLLLGETEEAVLNLEQARSLSDAGLPFNDPVLLAAQCLESSARAPAEEADRLAAMGQVDAAAAIYKQLMDEFPELSGPSLSYANLLLQAGHADMAAAEFRKIRTRFPQEPMATYGLGFSLQAAGDAAGARRAFADCVAQKPDFAEAHLSLALLEEDAGNTESAIQSLQRAIDASPDLVPAHLALGRILIHRDEYTEGILHLETAVRLAPGDAAVRKYLNEAVRAR